MTTPFLYTPTFAPVFNGQSVPNGLLYTYEAGTTNPKPTFADAAGIVPNSNPVQLDVTGAATVRLEPGAYHFVLTDSTGTTVYWDQDFFRAPYLTAADLFALLNSASTPELSLGITPANPAYNEGDIRRYGALQQSDAATQIANSSALQTALNVSGAGGRAAYIPSGTWAYSTAPIAPTASSMHGDGQNSILNPNGCDGLQFAAAGNILKSRFFRDFQINGTNTGTNRDGIVINFSAASANIVTGVVFSNITIQNFFYGVFCRGLWQSAFQDCFLYNNYNGYYFHGQSVVNRIEGGFIQKSTLAGSGTQVGVTIDSVAGESCQSLHMIDMAIYGYDVNVSLGPCLYTVIENCDLSVANQTGISVGATSSGLIIRDCWIQTHTATAAVTVGISLADLGTAVLDKIIIDGCTLVCDVANAGSQAIYVGTNQQGVTISNCTIGNVSGAFASGVVSNGLSHNLRVEKNTIYASTAAITISSNATDVSVHDNTIQNGTQLTFTGLTPARLSYRASGQFTMTLTAMSATITGTVNWNADGHTVTLSPVTAGIAGTSNATTMTGTGLPQYLWPVTNQSAIFITIDSGVGSFGVGTIASASGVITFKKDANGTAFTGSGNKGLGSINSVYSYS